MIGMYIYIYLAYAWHVIGGNVGHIDATYRG